MNTIQKNYPLKPHNTFHLDVKTKYFTQIKSIADVEELVASGMIGSEKYFILGAGAKVLFSKDYAGLIINMGIKGKRVIKEDDTYIWLDVNGGEHWPQLVEYTVNQGWDGLENLALIPGTAGAAPVQNIGAYGKSLEDVFVSLEAVDLVTGDMLQLTVNECGFGYRDSVFKHELANNYLITKITIRLTKDGQLDTAYQSRYESIKSELEKFTTSPYSSKDVYRAIVSIRRNKLPDINEVGSVGSFFKNPMVSKEKLDALLKIAPGIQYYPADGGDKAKVPAGWLLEEIGWKGKRIGNCGTWGEHALIVVNYGGASPQELLDFIDTIKQDFNNHYGIRLENEAVVV